MAAIANNQEVRLDQGLYTFTYHMSTGTAKLQIKTLESTDTYVDVTDSSKSASDQIDLEVGGSVLVKAVLTGDAVCHLAEK